MDEKIPETGAENAAYKSYPYPWENGDPNKIPTVQELFDDIDTMTEATRAHLEKTTGTTKMFPDRSAEESAKLFTEAIEYLAEEAKRNGVPEISEERKARIEAIVNYVPKEIPATYELLVEASGIKERQWEIEFLKGVERRRAERDSVYITEYGNIGVGPFVKWKRIGNEIEIPYRIEVHHEDEPNKKYILYGGSKIGSLRIVAANEDLIMAKDLVQAVKDKHEADTSTNNWFKCGGICKGYLADNPYRADIHWNEHKVLVETVINGKPEKTLGSVDRRIVGTPIISAKRINNKKNEVKSMTNESIADEQNYKYFILTESGIVPTDFDRNIILGANAIKDGKVVEIARKAKKLLENGDEKGFLNLLVVLEMKEGDDIPIAYLSEARSTLSEEEDDILFSTWITEMNDDIWRILQNLISKDQKRVLTENGIPFTEGSVHIKYGQYLKSIAK